MYLSLRMIQEPILLHGIFVSRKVSIKHLHYRGTYSYEKKKESCFI